ncbi:hypothetical protein [uncultured Porphyromonas sp.]|uniref:hypothetical protein n=1 Tax=uncultured Porphyromonas sp. TaxID=159274 RepID=UPI0025EF4F3E|nr:hypothetical protein [uncultured Porphyromonas sp.]
MELEKEIYIEAMQEWASEFALEDKSLEWLTEKKEIASRSIANCEKSAKEIREYIISEYNGREGASEEVKELKDELVEAIEMEAELEKVIVKQLDKEITKRLEATDK